MSDLATQRDVPPADEQRSAFAHLDRYELVKPWDNDSRLFAIQHENRITAGQVLDEELQLVTLTRDVLSTMAYGNHGELSWYRGTWEVTGRTRTPLSGWDGNESHEIKVTQQKFKHENTIILTRVDACELLAWFPEETEG